MKKCFPLFLMVLLASACTSTKNLNYLSNLPETKDVQFFPYDIPDYKVQYRDILYIDIKILNEEGKIENVLQGNSSLSQSYIQSETNQYLLGYNIDKEGFITIPVIGQINVGQKTLPEIQKLVQSKIDSIYKHAYVDVKLLSFKYTVLGEARTPGTYVNYNNYLTVLEAIGRAGGVGDYGRRDRVLVLRTVKNGTNTYRVDLKDKNILSSEAYYLMPNDVVIIEPLKHKIFNLNMPTYAFTITTITSVITTTLLLINFFGK